VSELLRVNLMSSDRPIEGWLNVDMQQLPGVDLVFKIDPFHPRLPWMSDTVGAVYWNNGPEHILNVDEMIQELWRVSAHGAKWHLLTPGYLDPNSWRDPTHFSHWEARILDFYTREGFDGRHYPPARLAYVLRGDNEHGLEFWVTVDKHGGGD
jgi:hypothetical protein